jgi:hypothetical protein
VTNVLVVSTTVRVLHRVHGNTTSLWPRVPLDAVLVEGTSSLEQRLVDTTTACNDANSATALVLEPLLGARRETNLDTVLVDIVCHDGGVVARALGNGTTVTNLGLKVADHTTVWDALELGSVTHVESSFGSGKDKHASVHALGGDHELLVQFVLAGVVEVHLGERSATAGVVNNLLDDSLNETILLCEVQVAELGASLAETGVGCEDTSTSFTLGPNDTNFIKT